MILTKSVLKINKSSTARSLVTISNQNLFTLSGIIWKNNVQKYSKKWPEEGPIDVRLERDCRARKCREFLKTPDYGVMDCVKYPELRTPEKIALYCREPEANTYDCVTSPRNRKTSCVLKCRIYMPKKKSCIPKGMSMRRQDFSTRANTKEDYIFEEVYEGRDEKLRPTEWEGVPTLHFQRHYNELMLSKYKEFKRSKIFKHFKRNQKNTPDTPYGIRQFSTFTVRQFNPQVIKDNFAKYMQKVIIFFKARPNCPTAEEYKKQKLIKKAQIMAKAAGLQLCTLETFTPQLSVPKTEQYKLKMTELCNPKVEESKPKVEECKPNVQKCKPKVEECKPKVEECKPKVVERKPKVAESKPKVVENKPKVEECKPKVVERKPKVAECKPKVVENKPKVEESKVEKCNPKAKVCKPRVEQGNQKPTPKKSSADIKVEKSPTIKKNDKCPKMCLPGCKPPVDRTNCITKPTQVPCNKLETPYPSFSELKTWEFRRPRANECDCFEEAKYLNSLRALKSLSIGNKEKEGKRYSTFAPRRFISTSCSMKHPSEAENGKCCQERPLELCGICKPIPFKPPCTEVIPGSKPPCTPYKLPPCPPPPPPKKPCPKPPEPEKIERCGIPHGKPECLIDFCKRYTECCREPPKPQVYPCEEPCKPCSPPPPAKNTCSKPPEPEQIEPCGIPHCKPECLIEFCKLYTECCREPPKPEVVPCEKPCIPSPCDDKCKSK